MEESDEMTLNQEFLDLIQNISTSLNVNVTIGKDVMSNYIIVTLNKVEFKIIIESTKYLINVEEKYYAIKKNDDLISFLRNYKHLKSFNVTYEGNHCEFKAFEFNPDNNTFILGYIGNHKYGIKICGYKLYLMCLVIDDEKISINYIGSGSKLGKLINNYYCDFNKLKDDYDELAKLLFKNSIQSVIYRIIVQRLIKSDCILRQMVYNWEPKLCRIQLGNSLGVCIYRSTFMLYDERHNQLSYKISNDIDDAIKKIALIPGNDIKTSIEIFETI